MKVSKDMFVRTMVQLGFKAAKKWDDAKLQDNLNKIDAIVEEEGMDGVQQDKKLKDFLDAVLSAKKKKKTLTLDVPAEVEEDEAEEAPAKKPASAKSAKTESETSGGKKGNASNFKKAGDGKGPGVIGSIIEFLCAASKSNPVTKNDIVEKLSERFPDKSPDSMKSTVNVQIPNRITKDKGLVVSKNENGYWIAKDEAAKLKAGKAPVKPAKAAKPAQPQEDEDEEGDEE